MYVGALALAAVLLVGSFGSASACQCDGPVGMAYDETMNWRLQHASNVVRGRIVEFYADGKTVRSGIHVAIAKMRVNSIVKGTIPAGDLTLVTPSSGDGSCSMSAPLLYAVASERDVIVDVGDARSFERQQEYSIYSCGYFVEAQRAPQPRP